jgi:geranylgeranyl diphosphate synthase type I
MEFQIRDDILGIWGDSQTTGKPAADLAKRKKTLPSLYALARGDAADRQAIRALFAARQPTAGEVAAARAALDRTRARRYCERMAQRYSASARAQLRPLPASPARAAMEALAAQLETRER